MKFEVNDTISNSLRQHVNIQDYILRMWNITNRIGYKEGFTRYNDRNGYIDLVLIYKDKKIGVEIDRRLPKLKSIEKANQYDVSILIERRKQKAFYKLDARIKNLKNEYIVILIPEQIMMSNIYKEHELYKFFNGIMPLCKEYYG